MSFISQTFVFFFLIALTASVALAQVDASSHSGRPNNEPLPQAIQETLAKQRIEENKKDYEELIKKGSNAVELSKEIDNSFKKNNKLTSQDRSKLKNLEKILKQIRSDLGGESKSEEEEEEEDDVTSQTSALASLLAKTEDLFSEIKKTSRHTISAVAINGSNAVLSIIKFLRFGK